MHGLIRKFVVLIPFLLICALLWQIFGQFHGYKFGKLKPQLFEIPNEIIEDKEIGPHSQIQFEEKLKACQNKTKIFFLKTLK